jgi:fructose-1,6-bisphosphatase
VVEEYTLFGTQWTRTCDHLRIPANKKTFAPANLRAASDNSAYHDLMLAWMADKYSLRYSGGLVPDVYHIFAKVASTPLSRPPYVHHSHDFAFQ